MSVLPQPDADVVVVGAGHNGLVAAAYLARAGLRVVVLERREVVGGAAITEELIEGFRVSTAAYSLSLLRPDVFHELELARHGVHISPKDPQTFVPLPDGRAFFIWRDAERTRAEIARLSPSDAGRWSAWGAFWDQAVARLRPLVESEQPPALADVEALVGPDVWRLAVAGSAADTVQAFFSSEALCGVLATQGVIGTVAGPRHPGTAWVMAYHAVGGELCGATGTWAYVRGGMGSVTQALARSAAEHGAEIRTSAPVAEVLVDNRRATGVRLTDGGTVTAAAVVSNADPKRTFLGLTPQGLLPDDFVRRVRDWSSPGSVVKVNLALAELPDFVAAPGREPGPQHAGTITIATSIDALERAFAESRAGRYPSRPFMEVFIQSATDPTLAPPGRHVLSAFTQWAPPGDLDREAALRAVLDTLAEHAPNLPGAVLAAEVLGPRDLEERLGLTGGNIFHGEILPEQSFGERFAYRTPLRGLYLCGSGASPGGGVMGAAGRNAARAVLADTARTALPSH